MHPFSDGLSTRYSRHPSDPLKTFICFGTMQNFLNSVWFALGVTLPSLMLLVCGMFIRRIGLIDTTFIAQASKIVFYLGLPLLMFHNLMHGKIHLGEQAVLLSAAVVSTLACFILAELYAWKFVPDHRDKGVFVQGVFRGNLGAMGLAYVLNAYGPAGITAGAVYTGAITLLFNILAVIALSQGQGGSVWLKIRATLKKILTNPLIIGILTAALFQIMNIMPPKPIMKGVAYMADLAVPLALLCAGAAFDFRSLAKLGDISMLASIGRLVVAPVIAVCIGLLFGLQGMSLGILFLMTATPLAAAAYPMVKAMGGNDVACANIAGITTIGSGISAAIGIVILRNFGLM